MAGALLVHILFVAFLVLVSFTRPQPEEEDGIPVMLGASLLKIVSFFMDGNSFTGPQIFYMLLGMVVAFLVSVYSIKFLMGYIRNHDFKFFGYYRIVLGLLVFLFFGIKALLV